MILYYVNILYTKDNIEIHSKLKEKCYKIQVLNEKKITKTKTLCSFYVNVGKISRSFFLLVLDFFVNNKEKYDKKNDNTPTEFSISKY